MKTEKEILRVLDKPHSKCLALLCLLLVLSCELGRQARPALGQISTISSPFSAVATETWESFPNYQNTPSRYMTNPSSILGGLATISGSAMSIYEPSAGARFFLDSSGYAQVADGLKAHGLDFVSGNATIDFLTPIKDFGAFWGATTGTPNPDPASVSVRFFNQNLQQIGSVQQFPYSRSSNSDGLLEWHGWNSTVPVARITYSGRFVVNDGLRINTVPEPTTLVLAAIGLMAGLLGLRRRIGGER